jgi:hypothetical protein
MLNINSNTTAPGTAGSSMQPLLQETFLLHHIGSPTTEHHIICNSAWTSAVVGCMCSTTYVLIISLLALQLLMAHQPLSSTMYVGVPSSVLQFAACAV